MYDVHQFRPVLYFLLVLGITGFALASDSPQMWILATGGIAINAWLVKTGRFTPLPQLVASLVTLGALVVVAAEIRDGDTPPILTIGQFIVALHLVKLYEQRANRDFAQLLILSLLLMVAAAISTASLLFGITFIVYLFVSLHCCLLFHLKVESDLAKGAYGVPAGRFNSALLRRDQRNLPRSMRRLTGLVAAFAMVMAVVVFLFFPRGPGKGMFGPGQARVGQVLTGFNDSVLFQRIAQIANNNDVVARVEVYKGESQVTHLGELLLRGSVLDVYTGNNGRGVRGEWHRSRKLDLAVAAISLDPGQIQTLGEDTGSPYRQVIALQPTGTNKLFAMAGPVSISFKDEAHIRYSEHDNVLETSGVLQEPITYTVISTGKLPPARPIDGGRSGSSIDPAILRYVSDPEVCGADAAGKALAQYPLAGDHSYDGEIAKNIERHLRTKFQYTLDLTDLAELGDRDPIVAFLTDFKKGHCEYFAGAMVLMCQSLGIPARYVVGFRCEPEDFNTMGNYYVVKQSNAHAWCEIYAGGNWYTFDPTSGNGVDTARGRSYLTEVKNAFDYIEFRWANTVVAYDGGSRYDLINSLTTERTNMAEAGAQRVNEWLSSFQQTIASKGVLSAVIGSMVALIFVAIGGFVLERWRLRRRARRIGLGTLPTSDQVRLVRQLGFYDDLVRILERHRIVRAPHLTPLEFSQSLSYLPGRVHDDIQRLTRLFYRIRYGPDGTLRYPRRHVANVVHRIQLGLEACL